MAVVNKQHKASLFYVRSPMRPGHPCTSVRVSTIAYSTGIHCVFQMAKTKGREKQRVGRKVLVGWLANNNKEARKNRTSQTQRGREKKKRESSGAPRGTDGGLLVVPWAPNPRAGNLAVFSPRHLSTRRGASDGLVAPPFVWGSLAMGSLHPSSFRLRPASVFSLSLIDLMLRVFHAANSLGY